MSLLTGLNPGATSPMTTRGLVLMLHGGAVASRQPVRTTSLSYQRARALGRAIAPGLAEHGIALELLRFTVRGWNDPAAPSPVPDARRALAILAQRYADIPIVLLGHSMGARTAARVADADGVLGVVGLAPWLGDDDPVTPLVGKRMRLVHGARDRITSPVQSARFVARAEAAGVEATHLTVPGRGHYLLRHKSWWNDIAQELCLDILTT